MRPASLLLPLLLNSLLLGQIRDPGVRGDGGMAHYAVVLSDQPVAVAHPGRAAMTTASAQATRTRLASAQKALSAQIAKLGAQVLSTDQDLVNAVFVLATPESLAALRALPGVDHVEAMRRHKLLANKAIDLVNTRAGWARISGGEGQAGAGVKIGIIDTGIDQNHPSFQDPSLSAPAGFPRCGPDEVGDCRQWTNNKVIVARSYVSLLNFQFGSSGQDTRPDDNSPRDRVGHGTMAAMLAAGIRTTNSGVALTGVAPKAYLGSYKVFGAPGVNDGTYANAIIAALNDARRDGMDVVTLSLGLPAGYPALEKTCGQGKNEACDIEAEAINNATLGTTGSPGMTVVVAAGNDGDISFNYPALSTIQSPGTAPGAIAVGATTNGHIWYQTLTVPGVAASPINTRLGNGPQLTGPLTANLKDAAPLDEDKTGQVCRPLAAGSFSGVMVLIKRGGCDFNVKVNYAAAAGAVAVILEMADGEDDVFRATGLTDTSIPFAMIGSTAGKQIRTFLAGTSTGRPATLDPAFREVSATADEVAVFTSQGPSIGNANDNRDTEFLIKPELVAPGTDLLVATQTYDSNSPLYSPTGFQVAQGTSFAAPLVAGAAALVKQRNSSFTPQQVKSAVVNSADGGLTDFTNDGRRIPARVTAVGAGKLNVGNALNVNVTAEPSTLPFGIVKSGTTLTRSLLLRNATNAPINVTIEVQPVETGTMDIDYPIEWRRGHRCDHSKPGRLHSIDDAFGRYAASGRILLRLCQGNSAELHVHAPTNSLPVSRRRWRRL